MLGSMKPHSSFAANAAQGCLDSLGLGLNTSRPSTILNLDLFLFFSYVLPSNVTGWLSHRAVATQRNER